MSRLFSAFSVPSVYTSLALLCLLILLPGCGAIHIISKKDIETASLERVWKSYATHRNTNHDDLSYSVQGWTDAKEYRAAVREQFLIRGPREGPPFTDWRGPTGGMITPEQAETIRAGQVEQGMPALGVLYSWGIPRTRRQYEMPSVTEAWWDYGYPPNETTLFFRDGKLAWWFSAR